MKRAILKLTALTLLGLLSVAAPSRGQGIYVEGQLNCGQWIDSRTKSSSVSIERYVIGVLNGLALGHGIELWRADGQAVSREAVFVWVDNYCRNHPLDPFVKGIIALYKERSGWNPGK